MEFYKTVEIDVSIDDLRNKLPISALPQSCASIYEVFRDDSTNGEINCIWGVFEVNREAVNGGVRFSFPYCPNTVAWTITTRLPPCTELIDVYLTIRRNDTDPDYLDAITEFMNDWKTGLISLFTKN